MYYDSDNNLITMMNGEHKKAVGIEELHIKKLL